MILALLVSGAPELWHLRQRHIRFSGTSNSGMFESRRKMTWCLSVQVITLHHSHSIPLDCRSSSSRKNFLSCFRLELMGCLLRADHFKDGDLFCTYLIEDTGGSRSSRSKLKLEFDPILRIWVNVINKVTRFF